MPLGDVIHLCPFRELRFSYIVEVKDHVVHGHPDHADGFAGTQTTEFPRG